MAPTAITSSLTSPPSPPAEKAEKLEVNQNLGLSLDADGAATPYSTTSTAVSEQGDKAEHNAKVIIEENLPATKLSPTDTHYFANLLASSQPNPTTRSGTTVYASAIEVLEAFAIQNSGSVWVYDDTAEIGFGARLLALDKEDVKGVQSKVQSVQTREGAGMELAGYANKSEKTISVFASTSTLPVLLPSLEKIKGNGNVVIHVATTAPSESLELSDSLFSPGVVKGLTSVPEGWEVYFSSGKSIVDTASTLYGTSKKVIHVIESTHSGRETTSFKFPTAQPSDVESFQSIKASASELYIAPTGHLSSALRACLPESAGLIEFNTLTPSPDALSAILSEGGKKTISVLGGSKADADALKAVVLAALYSASGSSKSVFPTVKAVVVTSLSDITSTMPKPMKDAKTISFYTAPLSPLPQLLAHLFLASPSLNTRLAQFGSSSARGLKSTLSLVPASATPQSLTADEASDVTWVSDANLLKSTDVLSSTKENGILVLELPWTEEEVSVKLTRKEIIAIKTKKLRVFLLDLDPTSHGLPIREQVAFLLLYTGKAKLPAGVNKVLDAFYSGHLGREPVEEAQAGLIETDPSSWEIPELEEGKIDKDKSAWEWDALPGQAGVVDINEDEKPVLSSWSIAARHLFFREAFSVPDAKTIDTPTDGPGLNALRPSEHDETFLVTVTENPRLTPLTYDRNVFHLEFDSSGTGLKYEIGEAIGIHGWNDTAEVLDFCNWYGLDPDALVCFPNPLKAGTMETRSVFQLLQQNIDLFGRPGKAFYAALAKLATKKADAMTLKFISAPEGAELFKKMAENETVTFADVLYRFRTARPAIEELVGLIPEIKPRHYSIASSQKAVGDKVELLIVTVDWLNSKGAIIPCSTREDADDSRVAQIRTMYAIPCRSQAWR